MADRGTGWEIEKGMRFDEIVAGYDKVRPEYPDELFEDIFRYSEPGKTKKVLEIGAGTGKATVPFLNAGYDVTAVEIGANMANFLAEKFEMRKNFNVIISAFEDADLEDKSYDVLYAATAFHWVNAEIGCPKAFRLLKSGGVIALFRYNAVPANGEALYEEIQEVYEKYYYSYYKSETYRPIKKSNDEFMKVEEISRGFGFEDLSAYGFRDVSMKLYHTARVFDADEYIAILDTCSDHRSLPDNERAALYADVRKAIIKHGGHHKVEYVFQLYMGRK